MASKKKTRSVGKKKTTKTNLAEAKTPEVDVVAEAQRELARLEAGQQNSGEDKKGVSWATLIGGALLGAALTLLITKVAPAASQTSDLKDRLPAIIEPLSGGMVIGEIGEPEYVGSVYKFSLKFDEIDEPFTSYITGDGKTFFVDGIDVENDLSETDGTNDGSGEVSAATCETIDKSDQPELAAYIVSDCPYGQQMQQVMLQAIAQAPELANHFKVRYFFDSISDDGTVQAMHGPEEGKENLRQICIREEQADKYWPYVECYANGGVSESCLTQANVNVANVQACMTTTARGPTFARADNAASDTHNVTGSPTLVINDNVTVSESDFGGRNANSLKNIVCCSSGNSLSFCTDTLSTDGAAASGNC
jgi:hypothetical protein